MPQFSSGSTPLTVVYPLMVNIRVYLPCVYRLTGRSDRRSPASAARIPIFAPQAAASAARTRRCCYCSASADHYRTHYRQRHVRHSSQSAVQGHVLRTKVSFDRSTMKTSQSTECFIGAYIKKSVKLVHNETAVIVLDSASDSCNALAPNSPR